MPLALIFVLLAVALVAVMSRVMSGTSLQRTREDMESLRNALLAFRNDYGHYPTGDYASVMAAIGGDNHNRVTYLLFTERDTGLLDPWGSPYRVQLRTDEPIIACAGPDGSFGTADDQFR